MISYYYRVIFLVLHNKIYNISDRVSPGMNMTYVADVQCLRARIEQVADLFLEDFQVRAFHLIFHSPGIL